MISYLNVSVFHLNISCEHGDYGVQIFLFNSVSFLCGHNAQTLTLSLFFPVNVKKLGKIVLLTKFLFIFVCFLDVYSYQLLFSL